MKVRMNTAMAHPKYGVAHPGDVIELPDAIAKELIAGRYAEVAWPAPPAAVRETAMTAGPAEKAVQERARGRQVKA
jgi:hypothetical protein